MVANGAKWIPVGIGLIMAGIAFSELVLQPVRDRIQIGRENLRIEFTRIEHQVEELNTRLRAVENNCER